MLNHEATLLGDLPGSFRSKHHKVEIPFLLTIVHALKHPLAVLKANLQILRDPNSEPMKTLCLRQVDRMNHFIGQILVPKEQHESPRAPFNLNDLLQEIIEFTKPSWETQSIRIQSCFSHLPHLQGNKEALFQALLNLLINALEACPKHAAISISTKTKDDHVRVVLQDEGAGMDRNILGNLFPLYYSTKPNGNGLGLVIARDIIQHHGGTIEIWSKLGEGTTIWVTLPIDPIHLEGSKS